MVNKSYKNQVSLLLAVLPEVAKENCFALHGGTAINLFIRDMPRLSVDIDLTYLPLEDRETTLSNISDALERIKANIESTVKNIKIEHKKDISKLQISSKDAQIKIEVNQVCRGTIEPPEKISLCEKAQNEYDAFCAISVVPTGQLYGGKICAALDRQHPRDLFDIKYLLENEGFSEDIKKGFMLCLVSSDRPIHEIIAPNFHDQTQAMKNNFEGMSTEPFSYDDYENTRDILLENVQAAMTQKDKDFLLSIKNVAPDWTLYDFERFPAVQWKLQNLERLKSKNPDKHQEQYHLLEKILLS